MVDAEKQLVAVSGPNPSTLAGREIEKFQRVAVGIAELEGFHEAVCWWQRHRPGIGDRREADPLELGVGLVHVRDDDREMLEPAIRAPAVRRIGLSGRIILNEGHLFRPQPHGQCFGPAVAQSDKMGDLSPAISPRPTVSKPNPSR